MHLPSVQVPQKIVWFDLKLIMNQNYATNITEFKKKIIHVINLHDGKSGKTYGTLTQRGEDAIKTSERGQT